MNYYFLIVPAVAIIILIISIILKKLECFLNFCLRTFAGVLALYIAGNIMARLDLSGQIGINPATVLTVGLLGIPGFLLVIFLDLYYVVG